MKVVREEFVRLVKSPFIALVFLVFLFFNGFLTYQYVGEGEGKQALGRMHGTVLEYGVDFRAKGQDFTAEEVRSDGISSDDGTQLGKKHLEETQLNSTRPDEMQSDEMQPDGFMEFYESYVEKFADLYENLDMMEILERKEGMAEYHPTGAYGTFVQNNYQKLQKRVEEIKNSGEGDYGFYPGLIYGMHGILYGKMGEKLLLEMAVLVILCILFLLDYERIHKTRDLVIATKTGKRVVKTKALAGLVCGLLYSGVLLLGTYAYFFWNVSFAGFWNVPVASVIMAEERSQMMYPFVTFWRVTEAQYFLLTVVVFFLVLLVVGGLTIAFWLLLQNSYFVFLFQCMVYMVCYLLAYWCRTATFLDVAGAVINPASLWITCGAWFMENDISLSFAGNEFWCVGGSGVAMVLLVLAGRWRYRRLEL